MSKLEPRSAPKSTLRTDMVSTREPAVNTIYSAVRPACAYRPCDTLQIDTRTTRSTPLPCAQRCPSICPRDRAPCSGNRQWC
jgi:hypothetical protein